MPKAVIDKGIAKFYNIINNYLLRDCVMRILNVIPDIGISNGVMSVVLNYAKAMPENIVFDVLYFQDKEKTRIGDIEALGGRAFKIPFPSVKALFKNKELENILKNHGGEWSAVHIHCPHFTAFIAPLAKKYGINKICTHCHTTCYSLTPENEKRNKLLFNLGKNGADKYFACSREAGRLWYKKSDFIVLNNAVDCKKFAFDEAKRKKAQELLQTKDCFVVGHIGRTDIAQKNHPFLIDAFAQIKKQKDNAVLLLIGAEPTEELSQKIKNLEIESSVRFLGLRDDVDLVLQAVDLFLFPSTNEGLPVSVIEAQAAGLPVLMSDSITDEVKITDNVCELSLNLPASQWAEKAIEISKCERRSTLEEMKKSGWDIFDCAKKLADYYSA